MAILSTYVADGSVPEDLTDILEMTSPVETPLLSMSGNGKASDTTHIWMTDSLAAATSTTARVEGSAISEVNLGMPTRESNITQIIDKEFFVSDTQEAIEHRGMAGAFSYQMMKAMKELARDTEAALVGGTAGAGATDSARTLGGLTTLILNLNSAGSSVSGGGTILTEAALNNGLQAAWNAGVRCDTMLVAGQTKRDISVMTTGVTRNVEATLKKQILSINQYDSDFGLVDVILERYNVLANATTTLALAFKRDMVKKAWLIPTRSEQQARSGDRTPGLVFHELTLVLTSGTGGVVYTGLATA